MADAEGVSMKDTWYVKAAAALLTVIVFIAILAVGFGIYLGMFWAVCWCFSVQFSLKIAIGVFLIVFFGIPLISVLIKLFS